MKTSTLRLAFATLLLAAMALLPAFAQQPTATLTFNGTVMTSSGGEFVAAASGQQVAYGTRVMVSEGSTATLTYPNGAVVNLTQPGVYTVSAAGGALAVTQGSAAAANAMMIGVAAVIAAAGIASSALDDDEDLLVPVSR
ncbi:MAG: hypothetical protein EPO30_01655 [Lysobacteraceae bacterium]|nr:MAG: hypothetical protein EPO30_01655 [Xanthomonadaceae bacterium]